MTLLWLRCWQHVTPNVCYLTTWHSLTQTAWPGPLRPWQKCQTFYNHGKCLKHTSSRFTWTFYTIMYGEQVVYGNNPKDWLCKLSDLHSILYLLVMSVNFYNTNTEVLYHPWLCLKHFVLFSAFQLLSAAYTDWLYRHKLSSLHLKVKGVLNATMWLIYSDRSVTNWLIG